VVVRTLTAQPSLIERAPLIELKGISKSYGGVPALSDVDFRCEAGLVHAVLGENGAGKSTLMKLLSGVIQPDRGQIMLDGKPIAFASPGEAARQGIVCMFQELSLMPHLTVGDNIVLARKAGRFGIIPLSAYAAARAALDRVGANRVDLGARVSSLTLAERQLVEIAKALYRAPRLLILDEATSALSSDLVERVFDVVRALRDQGVAILFISHRFHEVDALANRVSVFRNGRHVETFDAGAHSAEDIVRLMIGQSLGALFPPRPDVPHIDSSKGLKVANLTWDRELTGVSLEAHPGEIVGLGGLDGQGQQRFMQAAFGVLKKVSGEIGLDGRPLGAMDPTRAKSRETGLALIPEDRKTEGLILDMSIAVNLKLAAFGRRAWGLSHRADQSDARIRTLIESLSLTYKSLEDPVWTLSGGNQQKVVLAKWLALNPRCILLMDPTRGIDVKTKAQIYRLLRDLTAEGMTVILQSTDHEELIHLCDRVYVFYRGRVRRELSGADLTAENLISASMNLGPAESARA
jgi:ribose transport system ATP-binding protein